MTDPYPRDFYGYGPNPPDPKWPGGARLALEFAINFEAGGERSILHGDDRLACRTTRQKRRDPVAFGHLHPQRHGGRVQGHDRLLAVETDRHSTVVFESTQSHLVSPDKGLVTAQR